MPEYSKEQLWQIYERLPEELKEAIFSEKTADNIYNICQRNGIKEEEKISQVAKYTGYVLFGVLSPENFPEILEKEINLRREKAQQISWEINRFIFLPLKQSLEEIYKIKITPQAPSLKEISLSRLPKRDKYREPIE